MSELTDQIAEVLREHPLSTAAWGQTHCWCQQNLAADDFGMSYERHAVHVAQRVEQELQLTEETSPAYLVFIGAVDGGRPVHRWVSAWTEVAQ